MHSSLALTARRARAGRPTLADAWDTAGSLVTTALGLGAGIAIVDGVVLTGGVMTIPSVGAGGGGYGDPVSFVIAAAI